MSTSRSARSNGLSKAPRTGSSSGTARPRFGLLPIVWTGILLSVFQQFVGINVIFYYSTTLWRAVGFSEAARC